MSVSITSSPFALSWARNRNSYKLHCECLDSVGAKHYIVCRRRGSIPAAGNHIVLAIDGSEYVFTVVGSATGNAYDVASDAELLDKIRGCWYFTRLFTLTGTNSATYLSAVATEVGAHQVSIYCTDAAGNRTGHESTMLSWTLNGGGADRQEKPNYAVAVELDVVVNNNNHVETHTVKGMVFQPDSAGDVEIPLDLLPGFIPQPDLPSTVAALNAWVPLTNMLLEYRVGYGEMWGEESPLVQNWATETYKYALCGEVAERFARLNLPDWKGGETQLSEANSLFRVLGEDNGSMIRVCRSQAEYIYGMWFDPTVAFTNTKTVTVVISQDGGVAASSTHTVKNGEIYRIPVGPLALGCSAARYYTVQLSMAGSSWSRTFIMQPDAFEPTELLMQSKYGTLRSFVVPQVSRELSLESEELLVDRRRYLDNTDKGEMFTATTFQMTRPEAKRLAQCIGQEYHYAKCGSVWQRITIEAGSFKVLDQADDLVKLEFSYRFVENQTENNTNGTMARAATATVVDFNNNIVAFSEATIPNGNNILQ